MQKIIGRKPVLEAINAGVDLEVIYVAYDQHGEIVNKIFSAAKKHSVKITQIAHSQFESIAEGQNTQGVIAFKSAQKYLELSELINESKKSLLPLLLLLDSIQDPHNLGAILRTAECAGVNGVIITTNQSAPITETVEKISTGAISHLKICKVINLVNAIQQLKKDGFWIIGTSLETDLPYTKIDYNIPIALVLGNEEKGIRKLVAQNCDYLVRIPMQGNIQSLNVSVSAGIILFEILRFRKNF